MQKTESIGDTFIRLGLVNQEQVTQALEKQKLLKRHDSLGDVLVSMGLVSEKDRVRALGEQWGVPFVDVTEVEVDAALLKLVAQNTARKLKVLPLSEEERQTHPGDEEPAGYLRHR